MTDRLITDKDADVLADKIASKFVTTLKDEEVVDAIINVWSDHLDRHIGRTVRRGAYTLLAAVCVLVGLKMDAIMSWLRGH